MKVKIADIRAVDMCERMKEKEYNLLASEMVLVFIRSKIGTMSYQLMVLFFSVAAASHLQYSCASQITWH